MKNDTAAITIRFGTSGWRAIMADEFTFANVRIASRAIVDLLKRERARPQVIIGYDTRFLSDHFARLCAETCAGQGCSVVLCDRDVPTPVIAYQIIQRQLDGGINFTASHNPPEYNGIKFSPRYGGPAPQEMTSAIEARIAQLQREPVTAAPAGNISADAIELFNARPAYLKRIRQIVDVRAIKKARLSVAVDCLYGTGRGYLDTLLEPLVKKLKVFNDYRNPLFGGNPPEPDQRYIPHLIAHVKTQRMHLGLACDGDADRFGVVDCGGRFLTPNEVITLLFYYLAKTRKKAKAVARSVATTHMIDAIARQEGYEVIETPVGFKFIGEALSTGDVLIGGEESGGLSIQGHVPEKDGILACLLIAEMVAREKKSATELLAMLQARYGRFMSSRINVHLTAAQQKTFMERLRALQTADAINGITVKRRDFRDGFKFIFADDCWLMFRPSGTEPVVRCYIEAPTRKALKALETYAQTLLRAES